MPSFSRLVRFLARDGHVHYGDAILPRSSTNIQHATRARVISGDIFGYHTVTDRVVEIQHLLSPLASRDVRNVRCLALNYAQHAREMALPQPKYPVVIMKSTNALAGPTDLIPVPPAAQEDGLDYECEVVVVVGRECRDIPPDDPTAALSHILGYAVGNDVTHRVWQHQRSGGQWNYCKSFDGWAPWGPGIVTPDVLFASSSVKGSQDLRLSTTLNGVQVQNGSTSDMIFGVAQLISFLSQGTTLQPGDVIFTGTPPGVGQGQKPQPRWLKDGDLVEVGLEGVGSCRNVVCWQGQESERARL